MREVVSTGKCKGPRNWDEGWRELDFQDGDPADALELLEVTVEEDSAVTTLVGGKEDNLEVVATG